jgi:hypothetical protein
MRSSVSEACWLLKLIARQLVCCHHKRLMTCVDHLPLQFTKTKFIQVLPRLVLKTKFIRVLPRLVLKTKFIHHLPQAYKES